MTDASDPRVNARLKELHAAAKAAGYEDPIFGGLVIAATALVGLEDEMRAGRHPKGMGVSGVID